MIRKLFSRMTKLFTHGRNVALGSSTASLVSYTAHVVRELSDWSTKTDFEVYEQLYRVEPEVGGAIDRMASLVSRAYQGVYVKAGKQLDDNERRLQQIAQAVEQALNIRRWFEVIAELELIYGNAYVLVKKQEGRLPTLQVLPNDRVTIVDKRSRIGQYDTDEVIMEANYYVLNEGSMYDDQKVFTKDQVMHFKYKDTPVYVRDKFGRLTYGVYSPSPLERAILPVLWKREVMLIDIVWRWKNVPREHHRISSEMFDLSKYSGTTEERRLKAERDAEETIDRYIQKLKEQQPDQAYVTTDTIDIEVLNPGGRYMSPNELMEQISNYLWIAMGVPESIVSGRSRGSYASELVVSSYVAAKAIQMAEKIKEQMLQLVRDAVKVVDPKLPVEKLDMKIELIMETNKMELFRQASIMADLGAFTPTEVRQLLGYPELTEEQLSELVLWQQFRGQRVGRRPGDKDVSDVVADEMRRSKPVQYPDTPHVQEKHRGGG